MSSSSNLSENERATGFLDVALKMQQTFFGALSKMNVAGKTIVVKKIVDYASFIAKDRGCAPGEIIWLRPAPFSIDHNMSVLAAIKIIGDEADRKEDQFGSIAALILRAMTLISHAKTIAQNEEVKTQAFMLSHALGNFIDELMKETKS